MPFASLSSLARNTPLRILIVDAAQAYSLTLSGLVHPLQVASGILGSDRLSVEVVPFRAFIAIDAKGASDARGQLASTPNLPAAHIALVAGDENCPPLAPAESRALVQGLQTAPVWGAVGGPVLWLARAGVMEGVRTALPWSLYPDTDEVAERAILTPNLFELQGRRLSCCGGSASMDFTLTVIGELFGPDVQAKVKETLCIDRIRSHSDRQRMALQARFGALQPKLAEAVSLMEANIEEPLATDDLANLVGISRRQLERQFKQYLGSVPSRYYLELRLQRARQLLLDSSHSIVQIGLMCGFSSGSHFSTAYSTLFGISPREERQRKLLPEPRHGG